MFKKIFSNSSLANNRPLEPDNDKYKEPQNFKPLVPQTTHPSPFVEEKQNNFVNNKKQLITKSQNPREQLMKMQTNNDNNSQKPVQTPRQLAEAAWENQSNRSFNNIQLNKSSSQLQKKVINDDEDDKQFDDEHNLDLDFMMPQPLKQDKGGLPVLQDQQQQDEPANSFIDDVQICYDKPLQAHMPPDILEEKPKQPSKPPEDLHLNNRSINVSLVEDNAQISNQYKLQHSSLKRSKARTPVQPIITEDQTYDPQQQQNVQEERVKRCKQDTGQRQSGNDTQNLNEGQESRKSQQKRPLIFDRPLLTSVIVSREGAAMNQSSNRNIYTSQQQQQQQNKIDQQQQQQQVKITNLYNSRIQSEANEYEGGLLSKQPSETDIKSCVIPGEVQTPNNNKRQLYNHSQYQSDISPNAKGRQQQQQLPINYFSSQRQTVSPEKLGETEPALLIPYKLLKSTFQEDIFNLRNCNQAIYFNNIITQIPKNQITKVQEAKNFITILLKQLQDIRSSNEQVSEDVSHFSIQIKYYQEHVTIDELIQDKYWEKLQCEGQACQNSLQALSKKIGIYQIACQPNVIKQEIIQQFIHFRDPLSVALKYQKQVAETEKIMLCINELQLDCIKATQFFQSNINMSLEELARRMQMGDGDPNQQGLANVGFILLQCKKVDIFCKDCELGFKILVKLFYDELMNISNEVLQMGRECDEQLQSFSRASTNINNFISIRSSEIQPIEKQTAVLKNDIGSIAYPILQNKDGNQQRVKNARQWLAKFQQQLIEIETKINNQPQNQQQFYSKIQKQEKENQLEKIAQLMKEIEGILVICEQIDKVEQIEQKVDDVRKRRNLIVHRFDALHNQDEIQRKYTMQNPVEQELILKDFQELQTLNQQLIEAKDNLGYHQFAESQLLLPTMLQQCNNGVEEELRLLELNKQDILRQYEEYLKTDNFKQPLQNAQDILQYIEQKMLQNSPMPEQQFVKLQGDVEVILKRLEHLKQSALVDQTFTQACEKTEKILSKKKDEFFEWQRLKKLEEILDVNNAIKAIGYCKLQVQLSNLSSGGGIGSQGGGVGNSNGRSSSGNNPRNTESSQDGRKSTGLQKQNIFKPKVDIEDLLKEYQFYQIQISKNKGSEGKVQLLQELQDCLTPISQTFRQIQQCINNQNVQGQDFEQLFYNMREAVENVLQKSQQLNDKNQQSIMEVLDKVIEAGSFILKKYDMI